KLFYSLYAAEQAGLSPGITSAFRDDYRQSIISGLKAANDRSYHGGSFRGGYGHGLAADVVSVKGATRAQRWISTERFWKGNDPTRFKQAFKQDAGSKATKLKSVAISQATAPARAGSAARYTNRGAISGRPTMAALKRS